MDMETFNDGIRVAGKGKKKSYEVDYEDLSQEQVERLMESDTEHISAIFGVDVSPSLLLATSCIVSCVFASRARLCHLATASCARLLSHTVCHCTSYKPVPHQALPASRIGPMCLPNHIH
jgi:hypothetical protein